MLKLQPKETKKRKTGSSSGSQITKTDFDESEEQLINDQMEKYLALDELRYENLPRILWFRPSMGDVADEEEDAAAAFTKDELCSIMEWKTKHGRPRPALMGMIKSNQEKLVLKCTSTALKNLPRVTTTQTKPEEFPKQSMDDLNPLRGVGPATASLILSIATTNAKGQEHERVQVPFFSDDTYLWLCVGEVPESSASSETVRDIRGGGTVKGPGSKFVKPSGELNLKYNVKEYRELWDACFELQGRLGADGTGSTISMADIEKVAYVLRNIAFSGYYSAIDAGEILGMTGEQVDDLLVRLDGDAGDGDASSLKNEGETKEEGNSDKKKAKMA